MSNLDCPDYFPKENCPFLAFEKNRLRTDHPTIRPSIRPSDGRTDTPSDRDGWTHLKTAAELIRSLVVERVPACHGIRGKGEECPESARTRRVGGGEFSWSGGWRGKGKSAQIPPLSDSARVRRCIFPPANVCLRNSRPRRRRITQEERRVDPTSNKHPTDFTPSFFPPKLTK